ncbi:MAG: NADH-quinone oxidoreductase subunit L [Bdellovibrionales bacterium]|nr:NADH-quinone oxidoreductase subunit L [Bdellovibrionales bacterium]
MDHTVLMAVLILSPLIGFVINGIRYKKPTANLSGGIATTAVAISFISAIILVADLIGMPEEARKIHVSFFQWIAVDKFKIDAAFYIDQISAIMILVITGVGSLIHLFSIGYMSHDKGVTKYFAYLNLFVFNMLLLVLGDSLLTMFVGWEGVGLCSYLLIGFWFTDKDKAAAGMKAFITNRVGDAAFLLGMFVLFATFGTLNIQEMNSLAPTTAEASWLGAVTLGTMFLFIGATGKSAQIPLYVWLPDAMAGPTPVSALIHAATMVTAGVYMIVRLNPLFIMAPNTMMVIAIIGAATSVFAASIGITQWDIKKVLAYSTVSQLGYMFLAVGVGAFGAGMFHLMTHAFFKALMFLGSGSVIHAMHEEQDIRKMGGLKKYMPITHLTFFAGWLAIIGMPPFAGFFSKDEILWMSFHSPMGSPILWAVGAIGAAMTAFYMTRLMCLTFWGKSRVPKSVHPHESPALMTIPLVVLGVLSVIGGWIGVPELLGHTFGGIPNVLEHWLEPVIRHIPNVPEAEASLEWTMMGVSVGLASISAFIAYHFYVKSPEIPEKIANSIKPIYNLISKKFLVDELYFGMIINPLVNGSKKLWFYIDVNFIDKITYIISDLVKGGGGVTRALQTGNLQQYAMYIAIGIVVALSIIIMK